MIARRTGPALGVFATALLVLFGGGTAAAQSCLVEVTGTDTSVRLDGLAPGDRRAWSTTVRNPGDEPVDLRIALDAHGALAPALLVELHECDTAWTGGPGAEVSCAGVATTLMGPVPLGGPSDPDGEVPARMLAAGDTRHLRISVRMRVDAGNEYQGTAATVRTSLHATGDAPGCSTPPTDPEPGPTEPPAPPEQDPDPHEGTPVTVPGDRPSGDPGRTGTPTPLAVPPDADPPDAGRPGDRGPRRPLAVTGVDPRHALAVAALLLAGGAAADLLRRTRRHRVARHRRGVTNQHDIGSEHGTNRDRPPRGP